MNKRPGPEQITSPLDVAHRAALIGAGSAVPGLIIGATYGTLRTSTPILFSLVSGVQWFAIGTTFWTIRSSILSSDGLKNWFASTRGSPLIPRHDLSPTPSDRVRASTISGAITGATLGLLFRGPRNIIPGTIMFSLFGYGGQKGYLWLDRRNSETVSMQIKMKEEGIQKENFMQKLAKSNWSPMSALSDEEYERMIGEKVLSVEADIALIDERIEGLRNQQKEMEAQKPTEQREEKK